MIEKRARGQGRDRKRVLTAIRMSQKYSDTDEAAARLETESGEVYERMVEGKDLGGLRDLNRIFKELRGSFKGSEGFKMTWIALKDRIRDEEKAEKAEKEEAARLPEARRGGLITVLDNLKATGFDVNRMVADYLAGKPLGPIEEYRATGEEGGKTP